MAISRESSTPRAAFTLVEMIVVIVLIGVSLALVAPSIILRRDQLDIQQVVTQARRRALERAEMVTLSVDRSGMWRIRQETSPAQSGTLDRHDGKALTLEVSPLGTCSIVEGYRGTGAMAFNALTCELTQVEGGRE